MPDKVFTERFIKKTLPSTEEFFVSYYQMLVKREIEWLLKNIVEHQQDLEYIYLRTAEVLIRNKWHRKK